MAFVVLAIIAVVVGFNVGAAVADRPRGVTHAVLTPLPAEPFTPVVTLPAEAVARVADGHLARFRSPGAYDDLALDTVQAQALRDLLAGSADWDDAYPLAGGMAEQRWNLQLLGAEPRTIAIDNPLANRSVPESLYRVLLILLRPTVDDDAAVDAIEPQAMRLRLESVPGDIDVSGAVVQPMPPQVDPAEASSDAGQVLAGSELDAFDDAWNVRARLVVGENGIIVRQADGSAGGLFWGIDWSAWQAPTNPS